MEAVNSPSSSQLRAEAREALSGKWTAGVVATLIFFVVAVAVGCLQFIHPLLYLAGLWGGLIIVSVGMQYCFLDTARGANPEVKTLFAPYGDFVRVLIAGVLTGILSMIGLVLLVVPGVIVMLGFSQTYFLLRDHPELSAMDAMRKSWQMMDGHKMDLFLLGLSFIGWAFLACITVIGMLWFYPYAMTASARFYENLRMHSGEKQAA